MVAVVKGRRELFARHHVQARSIEFTSGSPCL